MIAKRLHIITRASNAVNTALRDAQGNVFLVSYWTAARTELLRAAEMTRQGHHTIAESAIRLATWRMEAAMTYAGLQ
jgi:hypothetical protein